MSEQLLTDDELARLYAQGFNSVALPASRMDDPDFVPRELLRACSGLRAVAEAAATAERERLAKSAGEPVSDEELEREMEEGRIELREKKGNFSISLDDLSPKVLRVVWRYMLEVRTREVAPLAARLQETEAAPRHMAKTLEQSLNALGLMVKAKSDLALVLPMDDWSNIDDVFTVADRSARDVLGLASQQIEAARALLAREGMDGKGDDSYAP